MKNYALPLTVAGAIVVLFFPHPVFTLLGLALAVAGIALWYRARE